MAMCREGGEGVEKGKRGEFIMWIKKKDKKSEFRDLKNIIETLFIKQK